MTNIVGVTANDNGLALTPPLGWRSWNLFEMNANQGMIEDIMDDMVKCTRTDHLGNPTSRVLVSVYTIIHDSMVGRNERLYCRSYLLSQSLLNSTFPSLWAEEG